MTKECDQIQNQLDSQQIPTVDPQIDPRPKLKVLRLLISVGLQTPERDHRHRRRPGSLTCKCGSNSPTIFHISWECSCMQQIRQEIWQYLPCSFESLPLCFQLTTVVPVHLQISNFRKTGI